MPHRPVCSFLGRIRFVLGPEAEKVPLGVSENVRIRLRHLRENDGLAVASYFQKLEEEQMNNAEWVMHFFLPFN